MRTYIISFLFFVLFAYTFPLLASADTQTAFQIYVLDQNGKGVDGIGVTVKDNGSQSPVAFISKGGGQILIPSYIGHTVTATVTTPPLGIYSVLPTVISSVVYDYNTGGTAGCGELDNSCILRATIAKPTKFQTYILDQTNKGIDGVTVKVIDTSPMGASKTYSQTSQGGALIVDTYVGDSIRMTISSAPSGVTNLTPNSIYSTVYDYNTGGTAGCGELDNSCIIFGTTPQPTKINLALQITGIGKSGNLSPKHPTRTIHVQVYKKGDDPSQPNIPPVVDIKNQTVTFDNNSGYFLNNSLDLGTTLSAGDYQILVKTPGYLRKAVVDSNQNTSFTLTPGKTTTLPSLKLIAGDTAPLYNTMDAGDFYAIVDCYQAKATTSSCAAGAQITDLNDDGIIDGVDLNIWLLSMQTLLSSNNPSGDGDGVTGN